jgi:hypothetical protein
MDQKQLIVFIHKNGLITMQEHDKTMEELISSGTAVEEPEPQKGKVIYTKIGCSVCGFELMDAKETKTEDDGKKYRRCYCFRCGSRAWRRTP